MLLATGVAPAVADVRSQALYARGLVPFDRGQWEPAYRLFDQAVQADPTDAMALYYRGLTQARRGQRPAAIQDMEQALKLRPALPHAALDLGIVYFDDAQYQPAQRWLDRAYKDGTERFTAAFFLGLTHYRLGDDAAAQRYLNEAKADPELRASAQYYAGLALLRRGDTAAGRAELTQASREQPQSEVGQLAQSYLTGRDVRQPPSLLGEEEKKRWTLLAGLGFEYDSNVVIAPSDSDLKSALGISREDDGRAVISLGGAYTLLDTDAISLRAAYDFYQSVHFQLTEFDLQGHRVRLDAASAAGVVSYGLSGVYDFYALDYQSFFQEVLGTPWVALAEGEHAATQAYYTVRGRDFFRKPYDPSRDAVDHAVGLRQYVNVAEGGPLVGVGYQFDSEDTVANGTGARDFQYKGHQADIDAAFTPFESALVRLAYLFRLEDYQFPNSRNGFQLRRHDAEHQVVAAFERGVTDNLTLVLQYLGVFNDSNIADFEYDRHVAGASLRVAF
jgi:tetratricopeptide (TPR) repeat protein